MSKKKSNKFPELELNESSTLGQRIAKFRKRKGLTQIDLAKVISHGKTSDKELGNIRVRISDYERDRIEPNHEMLIRLSSALEVTLYELLGVQPIKGNSTPHSLKIIRRMQKIEELPPAKQKDLLKSLDILLKGVESDK